VDVQNQGAWPSGKRAKFSHGPCDNRDAEFNFDPQIIAVSACPNVIPTALQQRFKAAFSLLRAKSAVSSLSDRSHLVH
jgi:hypothetical protein